MNSNIYNIATLLCSMQAKKVLVLGDIILDRFIDGDVTRISPEAPVPVLSQSRVSEMAGGAANVACNLAQLGINVHLIGVCGDDDSATALENKILKYPSIHFEPIRINNRPTSLKTRFRVGSQQILRVDDETTNDIDEQDIKKFLDCATLAMDGSDLVVISDYAKGALPTTLLAHIIERAKTKQKIVIADPKRTDVSAYAGVDLLTPNLAELRAIVNMPLDSIEAIGEAATNLAKTHQFNSVLTTMSSRGMILSQHNGTQFHDPASARAIFDVSGAGDTVVATVAGALAANIDLIKAVKLANHAAGVAIGKSGTAIVVPGELLALIGNTPPATDWPSVANQCASWRNSGKKIAFTNGCFDLLHAGHIHLLTKAANTADKLVIGLNSDTSVKRLKGDSRPLQTAKTRSAILAALPFVDAVAIFDEDTPFKLIEALQPDFIIKGNDYTEQTIVGANIVTERGGKVIIIPKLEGHSTSNF
ncbi:bifunctional heptose 7-phosphate kinase/heptose 1-phosphate adenyltransferase [Candidatus Puniceispirillum sp.]|nr:bifunctional heptose 7-phosphate kinase/heptose 1-phosphate adenyltransferase [Candidatus Puniceispirillum sp.]